MTFWIADPRALISPQSTSSYLECTSDELGRVLVNEGEAQREAQDEVPLLEPGRTRPATTDVEDMVFGSEDEIPECEECQPPRRLGDPVLPSQQEVSDHKCTHLPYRSWCQWCVQGRGVGPQHYKRGGKSAIPRIGLDYFYLTKGGVKLRRELTSEQVAELETQRKNGAAVKCLVVKCLETLNLFAYVIPVKGLDEDQFVVSLVVRSVQWLGHTRLVFKSDNEASLKALIAAAYRALRLKPEELEGVTREDAQRYDSQSNGATEAGIRSIRGLFRTMKLDLENNIGEKVPVDHPIVSWLLEHAALLLSAVVRKDDGTTPWFKVRGRPFAQPLVAFGESVLYKQPDKGPEHDVEGNTGPRLLDGAIFLGYSRTSNSYLVATDDGIKDVRGVHRKPEPNRWDAARLAGLKATPWNTRTKHDSEVVFNDPVPREAQDTRDKDVVPRRMRITKADLEKHGYTETCAQCDHVMRYGNHKPGLQHTDECRKRVMIAISSTPGGKARIDAHEQRTDRYFAETLQRHDAQAQPGDVDPGPALPSQPRERDGELMVPAVADETTMDDTVQPAEPTEEMDIGNLSGMPRSETNANTPMPTTYNSSVVVSTEGWLPRADDGSRAETPRCVRDRMRGVVGAGASQTERSGDQARRGCQRRAPTLDHSNTIRARKTSGTACATCKTQSDRNTNDHCKRPSKLDLSAPASALAEGSEVLREKTSPSGIGNRVGHVMACEGRFIGHVGFIGDSNEMSWVQDGST